MSDIQTPELTDTVESSEPVNTDTDSLADHEAQFVQPGATVADGPLIDPDEDDPETVAAVEKVGKFARHRAESQKASREDVQQINALTKELRTKEAELAKIKPDAVAGSPRLRVLSRQIKAIEAEIAEHAPKPAEKSDKSAEKSATPALTLPPSTFTDKEPEPEDYADQPDPIKAWMKAWNGWERKKDAHEAQQAKAAEAHQAEVTATVERINAFAQTKPDFDVVTRDFLQRNIGELLTRAVATGDKSPEFVYHLAQHPDLVDELVLLTEGKPITDANVAVVQRRLVKELGTQAVTTGSAAPPRQPFIPPRPPNPVRTGPIRTGDALPDDESSLADHERAFHRRR